MSPKQDLRHPNIRTAAMVALSGALTLCALSARADDPYPPPDTGAQKALQEARKQMRAEGIRRQVFEQRQRKWEARNAAPPETQEAAGEPPQVARRR